MPKLIANLVGLILQDKHYITYINTWGVFINEKKYYPYPTMPHPHIINDYKFEVPFCYQNKNAYRNFVGLMLDNKFDSIYRSSREYIFLGENITQMILMSR